MNKGTSGSSYAKLAVITTGMCIAFFGLSRVSLKYGAVEASVTGPSASHTGAPGETNCTECHTSFPVNSGTGNLSISGLPPNYKPGQQVPVTITVNDDGAIVYGSQTTAVDSFGRQAGTFTPPSGNPQTMQVIQGLVGSHLRSYVEHTIDGVAPAQEGTKSWTFTWTAPAERVGKISFYTAANAANSDGTTNDDYIYTTSAATLSGSALSNFDNDAKSDITIWRPSAGTWFTLTSSDAGVQIGNWGAAGDMIVPGDYDGDGKTDRAVWRPSTGDWYVLKSAGGILIARWGMAGDIPVSGDYDGDLKTDFAVWRPATGTWFIYRSSDGGVMVLGWGEATDKTAQADYDGDGKTDVAIYRPSTGSWYIWKSSLNSAYIADWGSAEDRPVQGDYDSDGRADFAVFRPSDGTWYLYRSSDGGVAVTQWGVFNDVPVPADYDGDGKTDVAVDRSGIWYILRSSDNTVNVVGWGTNGDLPVPAAYISQ